MSTVISDTFTFWVKSDAKKARIYVGFVISNIMSTVISKTKKARICKGFAVSNIMSSVESDTFKIIYPKLG